MNSAVCRSDHQMIKKTDYCREQVLQWRHLAKDKMYCQREFVLLLRVAVVLVLVANIAYSQSGYLSKCDRVFTFSYWEFDECRYSVNRPPTLDQGQANRPVGCYRQHQIAIYYLPFIMPPSPGDRIKCCTPSIYLSVRLSVHSMPPIFLARGKP